MCQIDRFSLKKTLLQKIMTPSLSEFNVKYFYHYYQQIISKLKITRSFSVKGCHTVSRNVQQTNVTCLWIFKLPATLQNWETSQRWIFRVRSFCETLEGKSWVICLVCQKGKYSELSNSQRSELISIEMGSEKYKERL